MAAGHSFDVVSEVDLQEVKNAMQQAIKEISTRFDFKGPPPIAPEPLDAWEQYAQVLLMSNEFVFVD